MTIDDILLDGSIRVLDKCGMQREGLLKEYQLIGNIYSDVYICAILDPQRQINPVPRGLLEGPVTLVLPSGTFGVVACSAKGSAA
jgi:hypothetical protein